MQRRFCAVIAAISMVLALSMVPGGPRGTTAAPLRTRTGAERLAGPAFRDLGAAPLAAAGGALFGCAVSYPAGSSNPTSVAVADLNGDGKPDLVTANFFANTVSVLLGTGNGSFQPPVSYLVGPSPTSVAVGDLNGDGKPDIITANFNNPGTVSVLLGTGNGSFQPQVSYPVRSRAIFVAVADLNGDGKPDLVTANPDDNTVSVLLGTGNGAFQPQVTYPAGSGVQSVAVADLNGDGKPDLVTANNDRFDHTVSVLLNGGVPCAALAVSPTSGFFTQPLTATGSYFGSSEAVNLYHDYVSPANLLTTTTAAPDGSFVMHGHVRQAPYGSHTFYAVGQTSGRTASAVFSITPHLVAPTAQVGVTSTVYGFGFGPGEPVSVGWATTPATILGMATSNSAGTVVLSYTPPVTGTHLLVGVGRTSGAKGYGMLTVR